jgi:hypothetical protein
MLEDGPQRLAALGAVAGLALWPAVAGARPDPVKLEETRSLTSEALLVESVEAQGRITKRYAEGIREDLAKQLGKILKDAELAPTARSVLAAMARHDAAALTSIRDRLVSLERGDGRAG